MLTRGYSKFYNNPLEEIGMKKIGSIKHWVWWFTLIAAAIITYKTTDRLGDVVGYIQNFIGILTPFIIGFVIAFVLYAPCNKLELLIKRSKRKWVHRPARAFSLIIGYLGFFAVLAGFLVLLLPALYNAIASFFSNLPTYYADVSERLAEMSAKGGLFEQLGITETVNSAYTAVYNFLMSFANTNTLMTVFRGLFSVTSSLFDVIMAVIISVYMLSQREALLGAVRSLLSSVMSTKVLKTCGYYARKTASIFYSYLYGTTVDVVVVAILMIIGLSIFGLPNAVLLGCLIGLMNYIPYFGAIIGGAGATLIALITHNFYTAIGVLVYVVVMQQIDGNIIQPRIVGSSVGIRPLYVLLAITVGGGLFGFWGMLIGVPVIAVIRMLLCDFIAYRRTVKAEQQATSDTQE